MFEDRTPQPLKLPALRVFWERHGASYDNISLYPLPCLFSNRISNRRPIARYLSADTGVSACELGKVCRFGGGGISAENLV